MGQGLVGQAAEQGLQKGGEAGDVGQGLLGRAARACRRGGAGGSRGGSQAKGECVGPGGAARLRGNVWARGGGSKNKRVQYAAVAHEVDSSGHTYCVLQLVVW